MNKSAFNPMQDPEMDKVDIDAEINELVTSMKTWKSVLWYLEVTFNTVKSEHKPVWGSLLRKARGEWRKLHGDISAVNCHPHAIKADLYIQKDKSS